MSSFRRDDLGKSQYPALMHGWGISYLELARDVENDELRREFNLLLETNAADGFYDSIKPSVREELLAGLAEDGGPAAYIRALMNIDGDSDIMEALNNSKGEGPLPALEWQELQVLLHWYLGMKWFADLIARERERGSAEFV